MFKKRESIDVIDIPELHRKKLIDLPKEEKFESSKITNDGFLEISTNSPKTVLQNDIIEAKKEEDNPLSGFLSDFASIGSSQTENIKQINEEENSKDSQSEKNLKWRIENLEYKLEQLTEKINSLTDKSS